MLNLKYTLLEKSETHSLYLFSQLPLTCILLNAVYLDMFASIDLDKSFPTPVEFGRPLAFAYRRRYIYILGMERYQNFYRYRYRYLKITQYRYRYSIGEYADITTDTDFLLLSKKFADTDTDTERSIPIPIPIQYRKICRYL